MTVKLTVCGIPFSVVEGSEDFENFGHTEAMPAIIKLNPKCSTQQREATLVHEWCHAVLICNGVAHDEQVIATLSTELYRHGFRVELEE